ncbi:hypothetical protein [uncultured Bacteroides sp.]|uniref:hypothetical protein n=1 Tax=uncultured Bacteroides sp. TaxID=162156 RepID=UPI0025979F9A|nr:hypothetical protein [uncultured Bacteroides sp.]
MSGKELKEILRAEGINLSELAKKLGYDNDQRLHSALKSDDVKSGLIESIAKAINKNVCFFYPETGAAIATENSVSVSGHGNSINSISEKFISLLEKKDEQMDRLLSIIESKF